MPFKEWTIDLGDSRVLIWRRTTKGVLTDFLVALVEWDGENWQCVTRYDCAHGFPHRDILGRKGGLLYKETFPGFSLGKVFEYAIRDCQEHCEKHARFFHAH